MTKTFAHSLVIVVLQPLRCEAFAAVAIGRESSRRWAPSVPRGSALEGSLLPQYGARDVSGTHLACTRDDSEARETRPVGERNTFPAVVSTP